MSTEKDPFPTLQAEFALAGHQLYRTAAQDGAIQYFCCRWGCVRALGSSIEDARRFLSIVTGKKA